MVKGECNTVDTFLRTTSEAHAMTKKRELLALAVTPRILFVIASEGLKERCYACRASRRYGFFFHSLQLTNVRH